MRLSKNILLASLTAASLTLAACGGAATNDTTSAPADTDTTALTPDTEATLTFAFWDPNQKPAIDKHIEEFTKQYPNVKIETSIAPYPQYWAKIQTQAEGGNLPDVFWMNGPNFNLYASNGILAPLDDLVENGTVDPNNYPQALIDLYSYDGHHYGFPKDYDTIAIFYNKALFDKAGVEYPKDDWTWDEFHTTAKTISDKLKGDGVYGVAADLASGQTSFYDTILQGGGYVVKDGKSGYAEPGTIDGLQLWADLIADGSSPNLKQLSDTPSNVMFASGNAAMMWMGNWAAAEVAEKMPNKSEIDIAPLPKGKQKATVIHGLSIAAAANGKNLPVAKAFIAYLASKEAQLDEAQMGIVNPAFKGTQEAYENAHPEWNMKVFSQAAQEYSFPYPASKNSAAWNDVEAELLPQAFSGERPVADVAKELAEKMQAALDEE